MFPSPSKATGLAGHQGSVGLFACFWESQQLKKPRLLSALIILLRWRIIKVGDGVSRALRGLSKPLATFVCQAKSECGTVKIFKYIWHRENV